MSTRTRQQLSSFLSVAALLVLWSTRAASVYTGDTTGEPGGMDACTAKLAYEASKAAADAADAQYRKLPEPDWASLSYRPTKTDEDVTWYSRDEASLANFLHNLKAELNVARQKAAAAGNLDPAQADKNYLAAKKRYEDMSQQREPIEERLVALTGAILGLMSDIKKLDDKIASNNLPANRKPDSPAPDQNPNAAKIKEYEAAVSSAQSKVQGLVGTADMDNASERINDPNFKGFSSTDIDNKRNLYDRAATPDEMKAAQGAWDTAIEKARQDAKAELVKYRTASRALSKLQSSNTDNKSNTPDPNDELRKKKAIQQKQIEAKIAEKAQLALKSPTVEELSKAHKKMNAANALRALATDARDLANDVKAVEPWVDARMVRNATQDRLEKAKVNYRAGIKAKDERLAEVQAQFNELQSWISTQRGSLQGRENDEEYWKTVAAIKNRAVSEYFAMEASLTSFDCFPDVSNLLNDIRARRKNAQAIKIGKAVKKPTPKKTPPRVTSSDISGWWVWLREKDRVPMYINPRGDSGIYFGVYFPELTTKTLVKNKNTLVVHINFKSAGGNSYQYRYKYPNSGKNGGKGGGVMTLGGNRMNGGWADDEGGAKGSWTLERPTASEQTRLRKHFGRG